MQNSLVTTQDDAIVAGRLRHARAFPSLAALLLFVAPTVVLASGCGGSSGPSGTYTATITDAAEGEQFLVNGPWDVVFAKGGSYTVIRGSPTGANIKLTTGPGSYYRGTTFVINPVPATACGPPPGTGTYHMQLSGDKLTFVKIQDPCKTRSKILARTFTKAGPKKLHPFTAQEYKEIRERREHVLKVEKERGEQRLKELKERREHSTTTK
jgi:hypothetical protein